MIEPSLIDVMVYARQEKLKEMGERLENDFRRKFSRSPIFYLELLDDPLTHPDPLTFHRTESTDYNEILDHIINREIKHHFDENFKANAIKEVNKAKTAAPPTKDNPIILLYNMDECKIYSNYTQKCKGYRIRLVSVDELMERYQKEIEPEEQTSAGAVDCD